MVDTPWNICVFPGVLGETLTRPFCIKIKIQPENSSIEQITWKTIKRWRYMSFVLEISGKGTQHSVKSETMRQVIFFMFIYRE